MKGNPIRLILLLIRLFYPFEKRKEKEKKKGKRETISPQRKANKEKRHEGRKPLNLDFDNRTKIEPVIKRFISSHIVHIEQFRTPTTTDTHNVSNRCRTCSGKRDEERK